MCVVASQLSRHVSLHGLENENQCAYRRGHSTDTALLSIKNQILLSLARGEATAVVLLDQSELLTPLIMTNSLIA